MGQFLGLVPLGNPLSGLILARNGTVPQDGSSAPALRVYGPNGYMPNGTGVASFKDTGSISSALNQSPIVINSAGHNLTTGARVTNSGVAGNTNANGDFNVTVIDGNSFSLDGSTGNGAGTGGTWHLSGLYGFVITASAANGYVAGTTYFVYWTVNVAGTVAGDFHTFTVI